MTKTIARDAQTNNMMNIQELQNWCFLNDISFEKKTIYHFRLTSIHNGTILDLYPLSCKYHIVKHPVATLHQLRGTYENALGQLLDTVLLPDGGFHQPGESFNDVTVVAAESHPYTTKQQHFIDLALGGENIFLTGEAGTGKSYITKELIRVLKESGKKIIALAPTGIAANNIDGATIHSMYQLTPFGVLDFDACQYLKSTKREVLRKVDAILVDEISMLRPDVLDAMHFTMIKNGIEGGLLKKQIIFIGDLMQLPSPIDDNTRSVLYRTYDGDTFQHAKIYGKLNVHDIELDEVVRQNDPEFIRALNVIRRGGKDPYFAQFVADETRGVVLAPHNATVGKYNERGLAKQDGEMFTFTASINGTVKPEDFNLEREIRVKNGCRIMYLVNSPGDKNPLRNGTLGIFVSHSGCHYILVGEIDYALERVECTKKEYVYDSKSDSLVLRELGSIEQYPIKLAYALSIHKSQGLTFDEITVDLHRPCFQRGQMYVALSRVRTPGGLTIITKQL